MPCRLSESISTGSVLDDREISHLFSDFGGKLGRVWRRFMIHGRTWYVQTLNGQISVFYLFLGPNQASHEHSRQYAFLQALILIVHQSSLLFSWTFEFQSRQARRQHFLP
jgi:hypothetical protein